MAYGMAGMAASADEIRLPCASHAAACLRAGLLLILRAAAARRSCSCAAAARGRAAAPPRRRTRPKASRTNKSTDFPCSTCWMSFSYDTLSSVSLGAPSTAVAANDSPPHDHQNHQKKRQKIGLGDRHDATAPATAASTDEDDGLEDVRRLLATKAVSAMRGTVLKSRKGKKVSAWFQLGRSISLESLHALLGGGCGVCTKQTAKAHHVTLGAADVAAMLPAFPKHTRDTASEWSDFKGGPECRWEGPVRIPADEPYGVYHVPASVVSAELRWHASALQGTCGCWPPALPPIPGCVYSPDDHPCALRP
jgi:hypothetical protein